MVAIAFLVAALVFGMTEAHFKCNRNIQNSTHKNQILDLGKLLSLDSLCMDVCEQSKCSLLDGAGGLLGGLGGLGGVLGGSGGGPLGGLGGGLGLLRRRRCASGECSSDAPSTQGSTTQAPTTQGGNGGNGGSTTQGSNGGNEGTTKGSDGGNGGSSGSPCSSGNGPCSQGGSGTGGGILNDVTGSLGDVLTCLAPGNGPSSISPFQSCLFPCMLSLNVLDVCDVQAIITKVLSICPKTDVKGVCVSACLCCGKEGETVDTCVNLCLSNHGIDLNLSPLKILGLGGEDAIEAPSIDGFEMPGLPLLPQLGLGGGASGSASGAGASGSGSGSASGSASGSGSSSASASGSASASSSSNSGSSSGSNGETTTGASAETTTSAAASEPTSASA